LICEELRNEIGKIGGDWRWNEVSEGRKITRFERMKETTHTAERERLIEEKCSRVWEESENENDTRERERERVLLGWVGFTNTTLQNGISYGA
jgi:hypothetical protein